MDAYKCAYRDPKSPLTPIKPMSDTTFQFNDLFLQKSISSNKKQPPSLKKSPVPTTTQITVPRIRFTTNPDQSSSASYQKSPSENINKNQNQGQKSPNSGSHSATLQQDWITLQTANQTNNSTNGHLSPTTNCFTSFQVSKKTSEYTYNIKKDGISQQKISPTCQHSSTKTYSNSSQRCCSPNNCAQKRSPSNVTPSPCKHQKSPTCQHSRCNQYLNPSGCQCTANCCSQKCNTSPHTPNRDFVTLQKSPARLHSETPLTHHTKHTSLSKFGDDLSTKNQSTNYPKSPESKKCLITNSSKCPKSCSPSYLCTDTSANKPHLPSQDQTKTPLTSQKSHIQIIKSRSEYTKVYSKVYKIVKKKHQQVEINIIPKQKYKKTSPVPPKKLCPCVAKILNDSGMNKYSNLFQTEEIDLDVFKILKDRDLKEIGLSAQKDRERLLNAIHHLAYGL